MNNSYTTIASNRSLFTSIVHLLNTGLDSLDAYIERVAVFNNTTFDQRMQMIVDAMGTEAEHEAELARMHGAEQADSVQVEIYEDNVWATDARYAKGGWETGAALSNDEDASDAIYAAIEEALEAGATRGTVSTFTWQLA